MAIMSEPVPPRTNLERELVRIWEQMLRRAPIGIRDNFFDLGGASGHAVRIIARIEELVHERLPLSLLLGAPTIERLALSLIPGRSRDQKAYVVPIQSEGEKPVLFCMVAGGIGWQHTVSEYLGPDQPILSIELEPGAAEQIKGPHRMEELARHMVSAICAKQPQGPYYLCGYCLGGLFAYEVARQLTMYGHEVGLLALIETRNPSPHFRVRVLNGVRRNVIRMLYQVDQLWCLIRTGGIRQYVRSRRWQLRRLMLRMSSSVSPAFQLRARESGRLNSDEFLSLEANFFEPKPLACPTALFRCEIWPTYSGGDPYFGWRELLKGCVETHEIPGDHEGLFRDPNVRVLAEKLSACLQTARQPEMRHYEVTIDADQSIYLDQSRT
jgi:thioesterase domain-containing protein